MVNKEIKEGVSYIEDHVKGFQDISEIAWRFVLGNRILESLDDMFGSPLKGTNIEIKYQTNDSCTLKFGDYIINVAHEPNSGVKDPESQPNSE